MADGYSFQISGGLMNGQDVERALPELIANAGGYDFEEYWHRLEVPAGGNQALDIDVLNNARVLLVIGAEGVTVTLGSTGTDAIPANPFAFFSNEQDGMGYDQISVANGSSQEQKVTVVACAFKS